MHQARIIEREWLCQGHLRVRLDCPEVAQQRTLPGEYCQLGLFDSPKPYAIYSGLDEPALEFLLRLPDDPDAEVDTNLEGLRDGDTLLTCSSPRGGFKLEQSNGGNLIFVATGSAIAPIRSAVRAVLVNRGAFANVQVFYGCISEAHNAISREIASWRRQQIDVHVHVSNSPANRIQGKIEEHMAHAPGAIYAAGQADLLRDLRVLATRHSVAMHVNF